MRKKAYGIFLLFFLLSARQALAVGYEPLVRIPGLPDTGVVDISAYLVGIYNFLLSIVGILAVIMLIIGGMKYITAAGNSGAVTDAKDTIWSALFGLCLALLSWVIVGTINPDVLYLRQPGAALQGADLTVAPISQCYSSYTGGTCTCKNGYTKPIATEKVCQLICKLDNRCMADDPNFCIAPGSPIGSTDNLSYTGYCKCGTGKQIPLPDGETSCHKACQTAEECGYKYLALKLNARHGYFKDPEDNKGNAIYVTSATNGDALFEFMLTNDGTWDTFDIPNTVKSRTDDKGNEFTCAILITDEDGWGGADEHMVYWVREGTTLGLKENLYKDIEGNYSQCCTNELNPTDEKKAACAISWGECGSKDDTEHIVFARYSYDIEDKCVSCNLADGDADKAYAFSRAVTCKHGYWK